MDDALSFQQSKYEEDLYSLSAITARYDMVPSLEEE